MHMASIDKREGKEGDTFRVLIRKKGIEISKSFKNEEDAKLYAFYKERLIDNMEFFEIPLKERITLNEIVDLKRRTIQEYDKRTINDLDSSFKRCMRFLPQKKYYSDLTEEDWMNCAKNLYAEDSWKGSKANTLKISPVTLRRIFAMISCAISHCQSLGIALDNLPLKIIQSFVNPMIKSQSK
jgi:hypothetical protein